MSRFLKKGKRKQERGITLIALITTIIVLLILAGISIGAITGSNGIIGQAQSAKEETEIAQEKEIIDISTVEAMGKNNRGNLEEEEFQNAISNHTNGNVTVSDIGEEFEVFFEESNRYYSVDKDGNILDYVIGATDQYPGDITRKEDGTVLNGSIDKPYEINCIEDLVTLQNMARGEGIKLENGKVVEIKNADNFSGKYVSLKRTLDFNSSASYNDCNRTEYGDLNQDGKVEGLREELTKKDTGCVGFKPIGTSRLAVTFDGEENEIRNIYQHITTSESVAGLFTGIDVKVKNLTLTGEIINDNWHAGGILSNVSNLTNNAAIENCINYANVTGKNMVGGIANCVSSSNESNIINCKNYGNITMTGSSWGYAGVGGIVGYVRGNRKIENCQNYGEIKGSSVGGIVGTIIGSIINNCTNYANINNGILGRTYNGTVTIMNCCNLGECTNGIVGNFSGNDWNFELVLNIQNSYNLGNVSGAGIIGAQGTYCKKTTLNIENCYNAGQSKNAILGSRTTSSRTETITNIKNTYYEKEKSESVGAIEDGITAIDIENNNSFVEILNSNIGDNTNWKKWTLGENGYPTL